MLSIRKRTLTPFGYKVKKRLVEINLTQKKLAERIGTSEVYLSMILYDERSGKNISQTSRNYSR
ncbi:MAG: helix-turn-helix domain-containing protein [Bacillota bacterium]